MNLRRCRAGVAVSNGMIYAVGGIVYFVFVLIFSIFMIVAKFQYFIG